MSSEMPVGADSGARAGGAAAGGDTEVTVRLETEQDRSAVAAVHAAAFPTAEESQLVEALRDTDEWVPQLSQVAEAAGDGDGAGAAGQIVGHCLITRCTIGGTSALLLAPVAVLPKYQDRGIGAALITSTLKAARATDAPCVVLLGHPEYYPRFGFTRAAEHGIRFRIDAPEDAVQVLDLREETERTAPLPAGEIIPSAPFGI